jgi:hypothetical protein
MTSRGVANVPGSPLALAREPPYSSLSLFAGACPGLQVVPALAPALPRLPMTLPVVVVAVGELSMPVRRKVRLLVVLDVRGSE